MKAAYRQANREKISKQRQQKRLENLEACRIKEVAYQKAHPEQAKIAWQKLNDKRRGNPECQAKNREWKRAYLKTQQYRDTNKAYREANREMFRRIQKNQRQKNPAYFASLTAKRRSKVRQCGSFSQKEWDALKSEYEYTCLCCLKREPKIKFTVDHVVPIARGGSNTIENIQPLCMPCNAKKHDKIIDYRSTWKGDLQA
jgi:5-methylcytosine-specific restriction endonuclease McrA